MPQSPIVHPLHNRCYTDTRVSVKLFQFNFKVCHSSFTCSVTGFGNEAAVLFADTVVMEIRLMYC